MQAVNLKIKGLYTAANDFTGAPDGALDEADDIVIDYENLAESRRGFDLLAGGFPSTDDRGTRGVSFQTFKVAHYSASKLAYHNGTTWIDYSGTFDHPDSTLAKVRFFEANQNLYISTATGVKKLDTYNGTPGSAGIPKGLDTQVSLTGSSGFFTTNSVATVTGTTTNLSPNLSVLSSITGLEAGMYIFGTGITSGTKISSITASATVTSTTGTTVAGSTALSALPINTGLAANQLISGVGIPTGTRIVSIAGAGPYTVTMSQAATAAGAGVAVTFSSDPVVTMSANATASGTVSLAFSDGAQIAYRVLFGIRDANNNLVYGAPSQFASVTNTTGATANVLVTSTIPSGITTSHFFQVYRSPQTAGATITPQDEMQLVYEGNPSSGDISNGYIQITDSTPDSLRGATLYTSESQEGIGQANNPPPYCKDFCAFKGFAIYANVKTKQNKKLTILSVGAPSGIQATDTLVIGGITFTADTAEVVATGHFQIFTSGTPAQNIADTTNSLIKVINRYASNTTTYAYLLSGPTDLPGQILIEERGVGGSSFALTASAHGSAFSPTLPTSGTTVSSAQDVYKNGIMISKNGQPEAVPTLNLDFAGSASKEILRVIPLREYVVILKQDGIFRLTGSTLATFSIAPFDLTTKLIAPDSAVALSNEVWGFFDQGVCSVSDTGTSIKSLPIQPTLRNLLATAISTVQTVAFAIAYETDHRYILALPGATGDTVAQQQYTFNTFTNAWTRWTRIASGGFIDTDHDLLYFFNGDANSVSFERKTNTYADYVDEGFSCSIVSSLLYDVVLSTVDGISDGDVLFLDSTHTSVITGITAATNTVTVEDLVTWAPGAATILPAIENIIQWKPVVAGNPAFVRQYPEGAALFKSTRFNEASLSFYSDASQSFETIMLTGFALGTWGNFAWGSIPWGGVNRPRPLRFYVPQDKQVCSQLSARLTIRNGYSTWKLEGLAVKFENISEEVG